MIYVARAGVKSAPRGWIMYRAAAPEADDWISFGRGARAAREWRYWVGRGRRPRGQAASYRARQRSFTALTEPTFFETVLAVASPSGDVVLWYGAVEAHNSLTPRALALASVDVRSSPLERADTYWDKRIRGPRRARAAEHMRALHAKFAGQPLPPILPVDAPVGSALWIGLEVAFAYLAGYQPGCLR